MQRGGVNDRIDPAQGPPQQGFVLDVTGEMNRGSGRPVEPEDFMLKRQPHENGAPDPPRSTRDQNPHRSRLSTCGSRCTETAHRFGAWAWCTHPANTADMLSVAF